MRNLEEAKARVDAAHEQYLAAIKAAQAEPGNMELLAAQLNAEQAFEDAVFAYDDAAANL